MIKKIILLISISIFINLVRSQCTSTSCGTGGQCVGSLCNCASFFSPTDDSLASCTQSGTCATPIDYTSSSHLLPFNVYQPNLDSTFGSGNWDVTLQFSQALSVSRNVRIFSNDGTVCKDFVVDLSSLDSNSLPWSQSIDSSSGNNNCLDVIRGSLPWSGALASCLRSSTDTNVYQGNIVTYTSLSGVGFNETQYGKKRDLTTTEFSTTKGFSFDFQSQISTNNTDFTFDLKYGTTVTMLLNTTTETDKNTSCLLDNFANHLNYPRNLFLVQTDIDKNVGGYQFFTFLVLDSDTVSSTVLANSILDYTNSTVVSCQGVSTISVNISTAYQKILFRLVSNKFDSSSLKLTLQYDLKVSAPIKADSIYSFLGDSLPPTVVTIGSDTCDSVFCDQSVKLEIDLSSTSCSGLTKSSTLVLTPVCKTGGIQTLCDSYLAGINGQHINLPISFSASWCPIQEKTELSKGSFRIYVDGAALQNGDSVSTTRTVNGRIAVNVDSKVTNSVLSSATVTQLILTDGSTPFTVSLDAITQSFSDQTTSFVTQFNHTIDPAITSLDFNKQLYYVATVNAIFSVPNSKRSIGRTFEVRSSTPSGTLIPVSSQSSQFKLISAPTTSTESPTTSTSNNKKSSSAIPIAIGVTVGCVALLVVVVVVIIIKRRRGNSSTTRLHDDIEMNSKDN